MNTDAQNFLKRFSTKKDALTALSLLVSYDEKYQSIKEQIEQHEDEDLAQRVMDYFNEVYGKNYQNTEKIQSIIRQMPKVSFEQFQSIILHKQETWGKDDKMKPYLRPATLFGSKQKFITYLEDATDFWIQKQKRQ